MCVAKTLQATRSCSGIREQPCPTILVPCALLLRTYDSMAEQTTSFAGRKNPKRSRGQLPPVEPEGLAEFASIFLGPGHPESNPSLPSWLQQALQNVSCKPATAGVNSPSTRPARIMQADLPRAVSAALQQIPGPQTSSPQGWQHQDFMQSTRPAPAALGQPSQAAFAPIQLIPPKRAGGAQQQKQQQLSWSLKSTSPAKASRSPDTPEPVSSASLQATAPIHADGHLHKQQQNRSWPPKGVSTAQASKGSALSASAPPWVQEAQRVSDLLTAKLTPQGPVDPQSRWLPSQTKPVAPGSSQPPLQANPILVSQSSQPASQAMLPPPPLLVSAGQAPAMGPVQKQSQAVGASPSKAPTPPKVSATAAGSLQMQSQAVGPSASKAPAAPADTGFLQKQSQAVGSSTSRAPPAPKGPAPAARSLQKQPQAGVPSASKAPAAPDPPAQGYSPYSPTYSPAAPTHSQAGPSQLSELSYSPTYSPTGASIADEPEFEVYSGPQTYSPVAPFYFPAAPIRSPAKPRDTPDRMPSSATGPSPGRPVPSAPAHPFGPMRSAASAAAPSKPGAESLQQATAAPGCNESASLQKSPAASGGQTSQGLASANPSPSAALVEPSMSQAPAGGHSAGRPVQRMVVSPPASAEPAEPINWLDALGMPSKERQDRNGDRRGEPESNAQGKKRRREEAVQASQARPPQPSQQENESESKRHRAMQTQSEAAQASAAPEVGCKLLVTWSYRDMSDCEASAAFVISSPTCWIAGHPGCHSPVALLGIPTCQSTSLSIYDTQYSSPSLSLTSKMLNASAKWWTAQKVQVRLSKARKQHDSFTLIAGRGCALAKPRPHLRHLRALIQQ